MQLNCLKNTPKVYYIENKSSSSYLYDFDDNEKPIIGKDSKKRVFFEGLGMAETVCKEVISKIGYGWSIGCAFLKILPQPVKICKKIEED